MYLYHAVHTSLLGQGKDCNERVPSETPRSTKPNVSVRAYRQGVRPSPWRESAASRLATTTAVRTSRDQSSDVAGRADAGGKADGRAAGYNYGGLITSEDASIHMREGARRATRSCL